MTKSTAIIILMMGLIGFYCYSAISLVKSMDNTMNKRFNTIERLLR